MDEENQETEVEQYEHQKDFDLEDVLAKVHDDQATMLSESLSPLFDELRKSYDIELPTTTPRVEAPTIRHIPTPHKRKPEDLEN